MRHEIVKTLEQEAQKRELQAGLAQDLIIKEDFERIAAHLRQAAKIISERQL